MPHDVRPNADTPTRVLAAASTHVGNVRKNNEDRFLSRPDLGLFAVADGMGGHVAGETASQLAVDAIERFIAETQAYDPERTWPGGYNQELSLAGNRLSTALRLANHRLAAAIDADECLRGMATTVVAALLTEEAVAIAHVGDSRGYIWRAGTLQQVTQDHTWVGEQIQAGILTAAGARHHPWRNVVTRALAGTDDPPIDVKELIVEQADRVLLCSDGLSGVIGSDALVQILAGSASLEQTTAMLIDAANAAGGPDNITAVMFEIAPAQPHDRGMDRT